MGILEWLLSLVAFPVKWYWKNIKQFKGSKWKQILLWIVSISGVFLIGGTILQITIYLFKYQPEIVVIVGLIIWLYAYIKYKMDKEENIVASQSAEQAMMLSQQQMQMQDQAIRAYPVIRNILYQTLKDVAESIGGIVPRLLTEIEVPERHFIFSNNICFYQFKLAKADIKMRYSRNDLQEFEMILQTAISRKIQAKEFPTLETETFLDAYGNLYDAVNIDIIEDMDTYLIIQAVFYSHAYAEYLLQKQINAQGLGTDTIIPDERWNNRV